MYRLSMRGSRKNKRVLIFFLPVVIFSYWNFRGGVGSRVRINCFLALKIRTEKKLEVNFNPEGVWTPQLALSIYM